MLAFPRFYPPHEQAFHLCKTKHAYICRLRSRQTIQRTAIYPLFAFYSMLSFFQVRFPDRIISPICKHLSASVSEHRVRAAHRSKKQRPRRRQSRCILSTETTSLRGRIFIDLMNCGALFFHRADVLAGACFYRSDDLWGVITCDTSPSVSSASPPLPPSRCRRPASPSCGRWCRECSCGPRRPDPARPATA